MGEITREWLLDMISIDTKRRDTCRFEATHHEMEGRIEAWEMCLEKLEEQT